MKPDTGLHSHDTMLLPPPLNALVLSGGRSSRMGIDKGEIQYHSKSQRRHLYELLMPFCKECFISCNEEQSASIKDLPKIVDSLPNTGPIGGLLSAFQYDPKLAWIVVACDLPFLKKETIHQLIESRNPSKMATAFWNADNAFPEPLVSVWEPAILPALLSFYNTGNTSPARLLLKSDVEFVPFSDTAEFINVNTIEEYENAVYRINKNG